MRNAVKYRHFTWFSPALIALIWAIGGISVLKDWGEDTAAFPADWIKMKDLSVLYVLFLLESAVSYMDMLAADRCNYMGRRAIASLLIKTVGTIVCILCMLGVLFRGWNWPLWIILLAAAAEKFDVEMFKKNEGAYIKSKRYKKVYPVL